MRLKNTPLRSTITQSSYFGQVVLHCHKEGPDKLDLVAVANVFPQISISQNSQKNTFNTNYLSQKQR